MKTTLKAGTIIGHPSILYRLLSDVEVETVKAESENDELDAVDDAVAKANETLFKK